MCRYILFILLFFSVHSYGQFTLEDCPSSIQCANSGTIFFATIPDPTGGTSSLQNCGGQYYGQMNLAFEATHRDITIEVEWELNHFLKMGIVTDCGGSTSCLGSIDCNNNNVMELEVNDLEIGRIYYIYVDGCFFIDLPPSPPTPFEMRIIPDGDEGEFTLVEGLLAHSSECEESEFFCIDSVVDIIPIIGDLDWWPELGGQWTYIYDGPMSGEFVGNSPDGFSLEFTEVGDYIVCLESVNFGCHLYPVFKCVEFSVGVELEDFGILSVCQHDLDGGWIPDSGWNGETIYQEGIYETGESESCCSNVQRVEVKAIEESPEEVVIELCPQDYPFEFLEAETYNYSEDNIQDYIVAEEMSLQYDYNQNPCDSLIFLEIINETTPNQCNSCSLPLSLEDSQLVLCLPFDNDTKDVSGNGTTVYPRGITYEENGTVDNQYWEAVFDGNKDYVRSPHTTKLNTSIFSINFQFNKDQLFELGNKETLVSKGDAEMNLRYSIDLVTSDNTTFDLEGLFRTPSKDYKIGAEELRLNQWYDIAYVVEEDKISLYINGLFYKEILLDESLVGNNDELYIGAQVANDDTHQYYYGRLDNFKYWQQRLSGQDVLFLHIPEKEFEVKYDYFLSCCESAEFRGITIDKDNPNDTLVVPLASPNGLDSTYVLGFIQNDNPPVINENVVPDNITIEYQKLCNETCSAEAVWTAMPQQLFSDNCSNITYTQSHFSPLLLTENVPFVQVTYKAVDACGQESELSFDVELNCLESEIEEIPETNQIRVQENGNCSINNTNTFCQNSNFELITGYVDGNQNFELYSDNSNLSFLVMINGLEIEYTWNQIQDGFIIDEIKNVGEHLICLLTVDNGCEEKRIDDCFILEVVEGTTVDYGTITSCDGNYTELLPDNMSLKLKTKIINDVESEGEIRLSQEDHCGCIKEEIVNLEKLSSDPWQISLEGCEEDFPIMLLGEQINWSETYDNTLVVFEGASSQVNSLGQSCDSTLVLSVVKKPSVEVTVSQVICEGETFEGYEVSGMYTDVYSAHNGCDSLRSIDLTVLEKSYVDIYIEICPDSTYMGYDTTGEYEILGTNEVGCDSITNLELVVLDIDHPECNLISATEDTHEHYFKTFPNPLTDRLHVELVENFEIVGLEIYNGRGLKVKTLFSVTHEGIDFSHMDAGIYFLRILTPSKEFVQKIVKL